MIAAKRLLAFGALLAFFLANGPVRAEADFGGLPARCNVVAALRSFGQDLPQARAAIRDGRELTIVALGSSSTAGSGASNPNATFPAVLESELSRLLPGHEVRVINRGVGGNTALQMFHRMDDEVLDEHPALVIWQTGVNDAIVDLGLDRFRRILRRGIAKLRESGADVVMMDHQPVPRVERYPLYADYLAALREVATETGTAVYRRYDVMNTLLQDGRLTENELFGPDNLHMVDASYFCVGVTLARTLAEKLSPRSVETVRR
ncbi:MAG: GDSL-type esterase/lipase family protein [Alphaproteobacteria bacterium]